MMPPTWNNGLLFRTTACIPESRYPPSASACPVPDHSPSITTTLLRFGQFLAGNRFAKSKAARLSRAWAGRYEAALKVPFLRSVVVILEIWPESGVSPVVAILGINKRSEG